MSRVNRVALTIVAVVRRDWRSRHVLGRMGLLTAVHVLLRHGRRSLRIGLAQSRRRRSVSRTLESGGIDVWRPDLWHRWRWSVVPPWFMTLALEAGSRLVARQPTGRNGVGQRVRAAVSAVVRRRNRTKAHGTARMAHTRCLSVRDERRHGLHARHGTTAAIGASLPIACGRTDP